MTYHFRLQPTDGTPADPPSYRKKTDARRATTELYLSPTALERQYARPDELTMFVYQTSRA